MDSFLHQLAAEAENADNLQEQRRQMGKRVRYGEIIQVGVCYLPPLCSYIFLYIWK